MRLIIASALLLASAPVFAASAQEFTRDGETYQYVAQREANGAVHLTGLSKTSNAPFDLTIAKGRVHGEMNGTPVAFTVSEETMASLDVEVAPTQTASIGN